MAMGIELFEDAYQKEFYTNVLSCTRTEKGYALELEATAFYPEGGGQPCDKGTLNGQPVLDVQREQETILHWVKEPMTPGTTVQGIIDWEFRYSNMQEHTAEHILSGLIVEQFSYNNVGFHMGDVVTLDFDGPLSWDQLKDIEHQANLIIQQGIDINVFYPDSEQTLSYRSKKEIDQDLRIVEIPGVDRCACCGTHVKNTREIGLVKILSVTKWRKGVRLEMIAGQKARDDYAIKYDQNKEISVALKATPNQTAQAVYKLQEKMNEKEKELSKLYHLYYRSRIEPAPFLLFFEEDWDTFHIKQFCDVCMKEETTQICAVVSDGSYVLQSKSTDLTQVKEELNTRLNGRGGGNASILQGKWEAQPSVIRQVLEEIFGNED